MPRVRESPSRAAAAAKPLNGVGSFAPGGTTTKKRKQPLESVVNETADDSFLSALKEQLPKKAPKRLFRRHSHKFQPEIPSGILDAAPASSSSISSQEASASNDSVLFENKVVGGAKKLFRRRSRFQPEIPASLFDGAKDHICTSTPFKKAAASTDAINVSCISPLPKSRNTSREVVKSKESDDGSVCSVEAVGNTKSTDTSKLSRASSSRGAIILGIIDRLNKSNNSANQGNQNEEKAPSPEKPSTPSPNCSRRSKNDEYAHKSLDIANVTFRDSRKKQNSRLLEFSSQENKPPPQQELNKEKIPEVTEPTQESPQKLLTPSSSCSQRSRKRSLEECLQKTPNIERDCQKMQNSHLLQMSPLENEIQADQSQQPQNSNAALEIEEITPKRRKINVTALVHATNLTENNVTSTPQAQQVVAQEDLAPRTVVQVPERGFTCTDCKSGTVMVDVGTSTSDLGRTEGITITRRCVKCSAIKLLVEASTSTTDLEAAVGQRKEVATSTTHLHDEIVLLVTEEAATSTTDLQGFAVETRKRRTSGKAVSGSLRSSVNFGGELNEASVSDRQKSTKSSFKQPANVDFEENPPIVDFEAAPSSGELNDVSVHERQKSLRSSFKAANAENPPKTNITFEAAPSGVEVSASERRRSVRSSSKKRSSAANAVVVDEITLRASANFETAPSGAEISASERRKSHRNSSKLSGGANIEAAPSTEELVEIAAVSDRQKSLRSSNANQLPVGEDIVAAAPSTEVLNETAVSERLRSLRSSSKHRIGAVGANDRSNAAPSSTTHMRSEEAAHESIFTAVDLSTLQQQESNVNKKKASRKPKQSDTTQCEGIRRSGRNRKPAAVPLNIVVSTNTRFVHNVNRLDYYKHENTNKENICRLLSPYLRCSAVTKIKTPRKSKHNVSSDTTTENKTNKSRKTDKSTRKTQNARPKSSILHNNAISPVAEVSSTSSMPEVYAPSPKLKRVKDSEDLAVAVCISDRANSRVKSGYLEISAGGKKMESSTQHQIVYTVFEGEAAVCIDGKQFRVKTNGEFIVRKDVEYSIRNASKHKKLRLRFVKVYV